MLSFLKSLFVADDRRRNETPQADQARKLEMDEPMAAAGAQLAGERNAGETERILRNND